MRLLILGGTVFLGRCLVEAALERGHAVTLFHRGITNADLFPEVEKLHGDRDGQLDTLYGRDWDAVIDTSGYVPRIVRQSATWLRNTVDRYAFISSISVYADFSAAGMTEDSPLGAMEHEETEDISAFYGPLKAMCEQEVQQAFGNRALIIRPGLLVGPNDPTDRFTYWVHRFAEGGRILVPGSADRRIQFIDVRDLADWTMAMLEGKVGGVFNATGPAHPLTMGEFVATLEQAIPAAGKAVWVDESFLLQKSVGEWNELPLWIAEKTNWPGFLTVNATRAIHQGLSFRPVAATVLDTLSWDGRQKRDRKWRAGMTRDREAELLSEWERQAGR